MNDFNNKLLRKDKLHNDVRLDILKAIREYSDKGDAKELVPLLAKMICSEEDDQSKLTQTMVTTRNMNKEIVKIIGKLKGKEAMEDFKVLLDHPKTNIMLHNDIYMEIVHHVEVKDIKNLASRFVDYYLDDTVHGKQEEDVYKLVDLIKNTKKIEEKIRTKIIRKNDLKNYVAENCKVMVKVIAKLKGQAAVNDFIPLLTKRGIPQAARLEIVAAIKEYGDKDDADALLKELNENPKKFDWPLSREVVQTIAKLKGQAVVEDLRDLLDKDGLDLYLHCDIAKVAVVEYGDEPSLDKLKSRRNTGYIDSKIGEIEEWEANVPWEIPEA